MLCKAWTHHFLWSRNVQLYLARILQYSTYAQNSNIRFIQPVFCRLCFGVNLTNVIAKAVLFFMHLFTLSLKLDNYFIKQNNCNAKMKRIMEKLKNAYRLFFFHLSCIFWDILSKCKAKRKYQMKTLEIGVSALDSLPNFLAGNKPYKIES